MSDNATNNQRPKTAKVPPALDLERPGLTQPWRNFVSRGWISEVTAKFTPTGTVLECKPNEEKLGTTKILSAGQARDLIVEKGLWKPGERQGSKKTPSQKVDALPKRSLVAKDFEGNDASLISRARSVANTLGDTTAKGRVGSLGLARAGADDFKKWWSSTGGADKVRLLTDKKHFEKIPDEAKDRVQKILTECPFRGPVPVPEEKEQASQSKTKLVSRKKQ